MANYTHNIVSAQADNEVSPAVGYQSATVCVPVTVTPYANVGSTATYGYGEAVITPGIAMLTEAPKTSASFTITQNICIAVPIQFGASASAGEPSVIGKTASSEICKGCSAAADA
ncbi:MAG: hypothetical protein GYA50_01700 [Eubacteriaceae bacterium]|nr:hypothetical protein [Eubacteriaceae bacterium]